jgi:hypothetical protein
MVKDLKEEDLIEVFINLLLENDIRQDTSILHMLLGREKRDNMKDKEIR